MTDWIDVQVKSTFDAGELLARLEDAAVQGAWQDAGTIHLYWPTERWSHDRYARLKQVLQGLDEMGKAGPGISIRRIPHEDWNRTWAQSVKPLRIGTRIIIRPSWETVTLQPDQIEIVLDPKQAFGTGRHATTRMLLEWLEDLIQGGESVLDVGTGSSLLAMVALRLGAARAVGVDIDPVAIEYAKNYARENRFGDELLLQCSTLTVEETYDLVLANLDRQTLSLLAGDLAACTGQRLLISGLLVDQRQEMIETFSRCALYLQAEREMDGWLAMELARAQSCAGAS